MSKTSNHLAAELASDPSF